MKKLAILFALVAIVSCTKKAEEAPAPVEVPAAPAAPVAPAVNLTEVATKLSEEVKAKVTAAAAAVTVEGTNVNVTVDAKAKDLDAAITALDGVVAAVSQANVTIKAKGAEALKAKFKTVAADKVKVEETTDEAKTVFAISIL